VEGKSCSDAAQDLGVSTGSVYVARSRVLGRLKRKIEEIGTGEIP
jgi:DNA-directed RNA polymerase specialized sigma24 family protein